MKPANRLLSKCNVGQISENKATCKNKILNKIRHIADKMNVENKNMYKKNIKKAQTK